MAINFRFNHTRRHLQSSPHSAERRKKIRERSKWYCYKNSSCYCKKTTIFANTEMKVNTMKSAHRFFNSFQCLETKYSPINWIPVGINRHLKAAIAVLSTNSIFTILRLQLLSHLWTFFMRIWVNCECPYTHQPAIVHFCAAWPSWRHQMRGRRLS